MATDYDKIYALQKNALGAPTDEFVAFFQAASDPLDVLDVGCGQGRDALMIARLGHRVTGVDLSPHGIADLADAAEREGLFVNGIVADIVSFEPPQDYDVVLIDRTLHMLEQPARKAVLHRLLGHVRPRGWCLIADEPRNIARLRGVADHHAIKWSTNKQHKGYLFLTRD